MKILLIDNSGLTPYKSGYCCEPNTGNFAYDLKSLNNDITMYGQKIKSGNSVHIFNIEERGINIVGLKRISNKLLNYVLLYLRAIPEIISSDFVYLFYPNSFKYIPCLCKILHKRYGLYIRGMQKLDDKASYWIYKNAYTIFTVSDYFSSFIDDIVGHEIANTIRPMIPYTNKDIEFGRIYEQNKKHYSILFLARIAEDKGLVELLNAMKILKEKKYELNLTIIGAGEFIEEMKALVNTLSISDIVSIKGAIYDNEEKRQYFLKSDIYILPTYHEGFPRTLYEAMIFGTPIITTFVGGIPALMKDDNNCKEIKPKSIESIVEGLEFAFNNYFKMIEFAKNATKTVEKIVDSKRPTHAQHLNLILNEATTN